MLSKINGLVAMQGWYVQVLYTSYERTVDDPISTLEMALVQDMNMRTRTRCNID